MNESNNNTYRTTMNNDRVSPLHRSSNCAHCTYTQWNMLHSLHTHESVNICKGNNNNNANYKIPSRVYSVTKKCQHLINAFTWGQAKQCEAKRSKVVHKQQQQKQKRKRHMTKLNGSRMCIGAMHGPMQNFCKSAFNQYMCEYGIWNYHSDSYVLLTKVSSYGVGWRIR